MPFVANWQADAVANARVTPRAFEWRFVSTGFPIALAERRLGGVFRRPDRYERNVITEESMDKHHLRDNKSVQWQIATREADLLRHQIKQRRVPTTAQLEAAFGRNKAKATLGGACVAWRNSRLKRGRVVARCHTNKFFRGKSSREPWLLIATRGTNGADLFVVRDRDARALQ